MFGFLKPLLRRLVETPVETEPPPAPDFAPQSFAPAPPAAYPRPARPGRPPQHAVHPQPGRLQPGRTNGKGLELPLQSVLQILPLELQPRVLYPEVGDATISVPLEKILAQLSRGTVKISFGELRMAAPGVFSPENDRDRVLVPLPLEEILVRLNPALITRRRTQRQVEVPMDISSPFDMDGQGLAFSTGPGASSRPEPAPMAAPTARHAPPPAPRQIAPPPPPQPFVPTRGAITSAPTPPPPGAIPMPGPAPAPSRRPVREAASSPAAPIPFPSAPAPIPFSSTPAPAAQSQPARPAPESAPLVVGLTALAESWPEGVRKEIVQWNLVEARVALPADAVGQALRQGRLAFSWKTVRSWLTPSVLGETSPLDNTVLELPLKVVAPLFLARQREASESRQKVAIDTEIPNLFFGLPQANGPSDAPQQQQQASSAVTKPVDTNYYIWDDNSDTARVDASEHKRQQPSADTRFIARCATPNEVVSRAAAMDGVEGSLIALPDGLMVASQLSPDLNGDTIAAFLPQIFSKVSACTKELRMGDLNNLNFTVGNIPWKIFRVNAIFFAAFGRAGQPLPTGQLAALASELDHKAK